MMIFQRRATSSSSAASATSQYIKLAMGSQSFPPMIGSARSVNASVDKASGSGVVSAPNEEVQ